MSRYLFIFLFVSVFSLPAPAQETAPAPLLGNPMEKTFNSKTIREADGAAADVFRRTALPPDILPQTANNTAVSGNTGQTFTGWNIGPPAFASGANTISGNTVSNSAAADFNAADSAAVNSGIGNTVFASPFNPVNPNFPQNFSNPQYNFQYNPQYNPQYDYTALAQQYAAMLQNFYQNQNYPSQSYQNNYGINNYGMNNYGMNNYGANNYGMQYPNYDAVYPNNAYPNNYNMYAPYNMPYTGNSDSAKGDLFSNMMMNGTFEQNPVLYQAMLQQEELRHRQSLEEEEEKEKKANEKEREEKEKSENWTPSNYMPPLAGTLFSCLKTISPFNTPTGPDRGVGMPLMNRSWLDRPFYAGGFVGKMSGSELVSNMIDQKGGADGGLIFGFNVNDYWGLDGRLHFASLDIKETANGAQVYQRWYEAQNSGASFVPPLTTRTNQLTVIDISAHYYPLGNAKFRPFFKYGIGAVRETFRDTYGVKHHIDTMAMPVGAGLKYWWNERIAVQMDIVDNIIFSRDTTKMQSDWTFSVGATYSFGSGKKRKPVSYWPYTPSSGSRH